MRQTEELTSELALAIIVALTSVSATTLLVPTFATTTEVPDTTSRFSDIVIRMMVSSEEDIRNITGAI